jgi:hypothetical protein
MTGDEEELEPLRDEAHERARKINPVYTEGDLVRVAWAANQAEAELIQGMLLEEGVPSVVRRTMGFDVPDFLAAGPRDIYVPASAADAAAELLPAPEAVPTHPQVGGQLDRALKITLAIVLAGGLTSAIAWLLQSSG